jgi:hypothetical protein
MKKIGTSTTATVKSKGLTCASLGEVESNNDAHCYLSKSYWTACFSRDGIILGEIQSRWQDRFNNAYISLTDTSLGTNVCMNKVHCDDTKQRWDYDKSPDIYVSSPFSRHL